MGGGEYKFIVSSQWVKYKCTVFDLISELFAYIIFGQKIRPI